VTAIVGAGPAGLIFGFALKVLAERAGHGDRLVVRLFDKREVYVRTHRLRMDPAPYRALVAALAHPEADALLAFLERERFQPAVSHLEERLSRCVGSVGVHKERLALGDGPGQTSLSALRARLRREHALDDADRVVVVGADSVHSTLRAALLDGEPIRHTHQRLARLRVEGEGLPDALPLVEQLKLSKLLRSLIDYRRHPDGYAEVDLFLAPSEHRAVDALGATPKAPVPLDDAALSRLGGAPMFVRIARRAMERLTDGPCRVTLWSTFRLEHQYAGRYAFVDDDGACFLVGDAAVSLPFFRGMAALCRGARELAEGLVAWLDGPPVESIAARYQAAVERIAEDELEVVAARGRLIRGTRELARISAMLPFPMQTWLLSVPEPERSPPVLTDGAVLNLLLAALALVVASVAPTLGVAALAAYGFAAVLHLLGGLLYRQTGNLDPVGAPAAKVIWRGQMLGHMAAGIAWPALGAGWTAWLPAAAWFALGVAFAVGIVIYERLERRWWPRADL